MTVASLGGARVLQTRPRHQSGELDAAIRAAGGRPLPFPVMAIAGRPPATVNAEAAQLPPADLVVFISANAVEHGLPAAPAGVRIAAIGKATAAALDAAARPAAIVPATGFDSEALLADPALADVSGWHIRIVRGDGGRELLGRTLAARGAAIDYVTAYQRRPSAPGTEALAAVDAAFAAGEVGYVVAMSVQSFDFLLALLPSAARRALPAARLVTPSSRVIQTATDALPGMRVLLAAGPSPDDLVAAMLASPDAADDPHHG